MSIMLRTVKGGWAAKSKIAVRFSMQLIQNFETKYLCQQLDKVIGRRYNIRPDLDDGMEPEIKGYVYKETIAGLFRAWRLNEMHLGLACAVNEMLVASPEQIMKKTGIEEQTCLSLIEECVVMGLLCENRVVFRDEDDILLYMIDTGGIFAFEESGIKYNKLLYTSGIDQRLRLYRKNIFFVENNLSEKEVGALYFFEDILGTSQAEKSRDSIILVDMILARKLGIEEDVKFEIKQMAETYRARIYDTGRKKYLDK